MPNPRFSPGDNWTPDHANTAIRQGVINVLSTDMPTDTFDGMTVYVADQHLYKMFHEASDDWCPLQWFLDSTLDPTAPLIVDPDTFSGNRLLHLPITYSRSETVTVSNDSGGWNLLYPASFPHAITQIHITVGDNTSNLSQLALILENCTLSALNGIAYEPDGGVVGNGDIIRVNYLATGF